VRNTDGGEVKGRPRFTNGVPGGDYYYGPATTALSGNRALLAYRGPSGIAYAVLDSGGNLVRAATPTGGYGWAPDAVQLSTGNIILAWSAWGESIDLVVLDGSSYNVVADPASLHHPAAVTGDGYVLVAADRAGHAILTWTDDDWDFRRNLYYALVDGAGNVLTDPLLFRTSQATTPYLETSYEGHGNTLYNKVTRRAGVDLVVSAPALAAAAPGGLAAARALVSNHGTTTATSIVLTATLDSSLAYAGAWPAPSVVTPTVVWTLADMGFLGHGQVTLYANVPSATVGTHYPITWAVGSASTDASPADNTATTEVMVSQQVFLPLVLKGR